MIMLLVYIISHLRQQKKFSATALSYGTPFFVGFPFHYITLVFGHQFRNGDKSDNYFEPL